MIKKIKIWTIIFVFLGLFVACSSSASESIEPEEALPESVPSLNAPTVMTESIPLNTTEVIPTNTPMPPQTNNFKPFYLDEPFTLSGGDTAVLSGGDLQLYFAEVPEDSRCPSDVQCFWSGLARIIIFATQAEEPALELEFNTNPSPNETIDTLPAYEYLVYLEQLTPYPKSSELPIAFEMYQIELIVTRP